MHPCIPDLVNSEKDDQDLKIKATIQTKVQVKLVRRRQRNAILSQFAFPPRTDESTLSSVWKIRSVTTDLNNHDESEHLEQDIKPEEELTVTELNATCSPVVPLQVLLQHNISASSNSTSRTPTATSSPLDFLLVSSRRTTISDFKSTIITTINTSLKSSVNPLQVLLWWTFIDELAFTLPTVIIIREWSTPGPRLQWQIAWYARFQCV